MTLILASKPFRAIICSSENAKSFFSIWFSLFWRFLFHLSNILYTHSIYRSWILAYLFSAWRFSRRNATFRILGDLLEAMQRNRKFKRKKISKTNKLIGMKSIFNGIVNIDANIFVHTFEKYIYNIHTYWFGIICFIKKTKTHLVFNAQKELWW